MVALFLVIGVVLVVLFLGAVDPGDQPKKVSSPELKVKPGEAFRWGMPDPPEKKDGER
jgi:hypothetical protein